MEAQQKLFVRVVWSVGLCFGFSAIASPVSAQQDKSLQSAGFTASVNQARSGESGENSGSLNLPDSPDVTSALDRDASQLQRKGPDARELWAAALSQPRPAADASSYMGDPQAQTPANQSAEPATATPAQSTPSQKPVGTAAAEAPSASGIAASQPAGVAIAPAKQRRVRTIVLRTGAIIGAGVAVGTVVALTAGTSSKPSGAH